MQPIFLTRWFVFLAGLLLLGMVYRGAGLLVCVGVAAYSLRGPKESVQALTVLAFLIMTSKLDVSIGRWAILFAAFGRTLWDSIIGGQSTPRLLRPILGFAVVVFGTSLVASDFVAVSLLKLVTFVAGTSTVLICLHRTRHLMGYWLDWLYTLGLFILIASIPFYFSAAGYARNDVGFQGIMNHPQTLGPILAPITVFLTGMYAFYPGRKNGLVGLAALLGWVEMYTTLSRTSIFAVVLALGIVMLVGFSIRNDAWGSKLGQTLSRPTVLIALFFMVAVAGLQSQAIQQTISGFIFKDDSAGSVAQVLQQSRGGLQDRSMANFRESPLIGIGFGAPSDPERFERQLEYGPMGIPVSASVEKGFMPSAVLEETGIIGAILVLILLGYLLVPVVRYGNMVAFWMLMTGLLVNLGEMIFFSMGGNGLYLWLIFGVCYSWALEESRMARASVEGQPSRSMQFASSFQSSTRL